MKLGFVGLGHMGSGIARNLLRAGHAVALYNRTAAKAEAVAATKERGAARVVGSPAEAARGAEVVLSMLADDDAVAQVASGDAGIVDGLAPGAIHVSLSTISPVLSRRLAKVHAERKQRYVAAPVFGRPEAAEKAQLVVLAAGPGDALATCRPLFDAIGRKVHELGDVAEKANVVKLGANFILAAMIETLGEAFALVEENGIGAGQFIEIVNGSMFQSPVMGNYGDKIAKRDFDPAGFGLALGLKDVRLVLEAAERARVAMPVASAVRDRFVEAMARGLEGKDWSAVTAVSRARGRKE